MLKYEIAKSIYEEIKDKVAHDTREGVEGFYKDFLVSACEYAKNRIDWSFMNGEEKLEDDASRSVKHDAFMSRLKAVCRALQIDGIEELMPDRKTKGDFACYIAMFLALEQR